ncbi:MAG: hypothetical protein AAF573_07960, partial [Bacteroidota bacterium]
MQLTVLAFLSLTACQKENLESSDNLIPEPSHLTEFPENPTVGVYELGIADVEDYISNPTPTVINNSEVA